MKNNLDRNIERNNLTNVQTYPYALYDEDTIVKYYHSETKSLAGSLTTKRLHAKDQIREYDITAKRLSSWLTKDVDLLKLDIEGVELKVLREIEPNIKSIRNIFCEYHEGHGIIDNSLVEILSILERNGFQIKISQSFREKLTSFRKFERFDGNNTFVIWAKNERMLS